MIAKYKGQTIGGGGGGASSGDSVPSGCILIWSGAADNVPDGWALCDGNNGTPDLRGRFVLGHSDDHEIGSTGGSEEVTLTYSQMPSHFHYVAIPPSSGTNSQPNYMYTLQKPSGLTKNYVLNPQTTSEEGGSKPHPNMPPYYTLCYIIKL